MVKNPPVKQETQVQSPGWEDPVKERATNSSSLTWGTMDRKALWATLYGVAKSKQTTTKLFHKKLIYRVFLQCSEAKTGAATEISDQQ